MSSLLKYYAFLTVLFVVVVIYNISFFITYSADVCKIKNCQAEAARLLIANTTNSTTTTTTTTTTTITNSSSAIITNNGSQMTNASNSTIVDSVAPMTTNSSDTSLVSGGSPATTNTSNTTNSSGPVCVLVKSSIQLVKLPLIIVILYGAMAALTVLAILGIKLFGDMPSERFGSLRKYCNSIRAWYLSCCGIYVRNFAFLLKVASYLVILLILVQAALVFLTDDCKNAAHIDKQGDSVIGQMYQQSIIVLLVDLCFWGFTHLLLPLFKRTLDQEAFLYEPIDNTANKAYYVVCNLFGP